jgi:hypothetical protein
MRSGLVWTQAHRASRRARQLLARTPFAQYSISEPAIPGLRGGEGLHQAGSPSGVSRPGPNPRHVPERDATLSNKRPRDALSRRAGLRPRLPDPPHSVPVGLTMRPIVPPSGDRVVRTRSWRPILAQFARLGGPPALQLDQRRHSGHPGRGARRSLLFPRTNYSRDRRRAGARVSATWKASGSPTIESAPAI